MAGLRFSVREIKEKEGLRVAVPVPVEELLGGGLFGEARPQGAPLAELEFSVGGSRILLQGRVEGRWLLPCSRCLAPHPAAFAGEFEETFPAAQETIDVDEEVRQALVLSLPERSLCREDCKGLCPRCGANLNEGPCRCEKA